MKNTLRLPMMVECYFCTYSVGFVALVDDFDAILRKNGQNDIDNMNWTCGRPTPL